MKNKIDDLRNHLFQALERLNDDDEMKDPVKLQNELKRAGAISEVGKVIVESAKAEVQFMKVTDKPGAGFFPEEPKKLK